MSKQVSETWNISTSAYGHPNVPVFISEAWIPKYPKDHAWAYGNDIGAWIIRQLRIPELKTVTIRITVELIEEGNNG